MQKNIVTIRQNINEQIYEKRYEKNYGKNQKNLRSIRPSKLWRATVDAKKKLWGVGSGDGCDVSATVDTSKRAVTRNGRRQKKSFRDFFWRKKKFDVWEAAPAVTLVVSEGKKNSTASYSHSFLL